MGTNYYWRQQISGGWDRKYEEIHVGKNSIGWSFGFHAVVAPLKHDGNGTDTIFGYDVTTRQDWMRVFTTEPGYLINEYDEKIDDPITWLKEWEAPSAEQIATEERNTTHSVISNTFAGLETDMGNRNSWYDDRNWRDDEGFRFTTDDFC